MVAETLMTNIDVPEEGDVVGVAPVLEEETVIEEPVKKPRGRLGRVCELFLLVVPPQSLL